MVAKRIQMSISFCYNSMENTSQICWDLHRPKLATLTVYFHGLILNPKSNVHHYLFQPDNKIKIILAITVVIVNCMVVSDRFQNSNWTAGRAADYKWGYVTQTRQQTAGYIKELLSIENECGSVKKRKTKHWSVQSKWLIQESHGSDCSLSWG